MDKYAVVYTDSGILYDNKKNELLTYATTWMNLTINMLSGRSWAKQGMCCMIPNI